ncbi:hypothetical protein V9T40_014159 [Parthenolecanium corni]|uniref:Uncharacterized protein n=1 Tax=Parthenolecanium corni TaxID=536013 RepID=A0AAN9Y1V3_9HEMI
MATAKLGRLLGRLREPKFGGGLNVSRGNGNKVHHRPPHRRLLVAVSDTSSRTVVTVVSFLPFLVSYARFRPMMDTNRLLDAHFQPLDQLSRDGRLDRLRH